MQRQQYIEIKHGMSMSCSKQSIWQVITQLLQKFNKISVEMSCITYFARTS